MGATTSYARARAESLGMEAKGGIAERADRLVAILVIPALGHPRAGLVRAVHPGGAGDGSTVTVVQRVLADAAGTLGRLAHASPARAPPRGRGRLGAGLHRGLPDRLAGRAVAARAGRARGVRPGRRPGPPSRRAQRATTPGQPRPDRDGRATRRDDPGGRAVLPALLVRVVPAALVGRRRLCGAPGSGRSGCAAPRAGRGVVVALPHMGNWRWPAPARPPGCR